MAMVKKIIHILSLIIYVAVIVFALVEVPIIFGYKPLVVLSGSMEPAYKVGCVLYYHKVPIEKLKVGDSITYTLKDGTYITHRIVSKKDNLIETKGDSNNTADPLVEPSQILGKVSKFNIPFIGYCYVGFIKYHSIIIGILVLILVSEFLLTNVKTFDINKKEKEIEEGK